MESLFTYLWKSAAIITLFYSFYKLLLQKETHFKFSRYFLFFGILASLIIPLISIPKYVEIETIQSTIIESVRDTITINSTQTLDWLVILLYGYLTTTALLILKFILQLVSVVNLIRKAEIKKIDSFYHAKTNVETSPFSFFNFIVYNPTQFNDTELSHILNHEKVHAFQKHSFDTIVAHILTAIQWFNPFVWLYKNEIAENLEFLADEYAQNISTSKSSYQLLLLKTTVPNYQMALVNNFYNSLLKKRIIMLHKQRSNSNSQWKYALIIPFLLAFIFTFNTKTIAQQKKVKIVKNRIEVFAMGIFKKSTKDDLDNIVKSFSEKGLVVKFSGIKRNKDNDIIAIEVSAKAKSGKASSSFGSNLKDGIHPIIISFDKENNDLSIGSSKEHETHHYAYRMGGGKKVMKSKGKDDTFIFKYDDDDVNVWITKDGDTTKIFKKEIEIENEEGGDMEEMIIEENDGSGKKVIKEIVKIKGKGKDKHRIIFNDEDDEPNTVTTYLVNGKKMTKEEFKKMDPNKIKTIEIKKEVKNKN